MRRWLKMKDSNVAVNSYHNEYSVQASIELFGSSEPETWGDSAATVGQACGV